MYLVNLYGYFSRKLDLISMYDISYYASTRIIKTIIRINDKISTLLLYYNINHDIIKELNSTLYLKLANKFKLVKSNVAAKPLEFTRSFLNV